MNDVVITRHVMDLAFRCKEQGLIHHFYSNGTMSTNKWTVTLPADPTGTHPHRFFVSDMDLYAWLRRFPVKEDA